MITCSIQTQYHKSQVIIFHYTLLIFFSKATFTPHLYYTFITLRWCFSQKRLIILYYITGYGLQAAPEHSWDSNLQPSDSKTLIKVILPSQLLSFPHLQIFGTFQYLISRPFLRLWPCNARQDIVVNLSYIQYLPRLTAGKMYCFLQGGRASANHKATSTRRG